MAPLGATGYDCAVTSEEIPERQKRFYTLVYATTTWDDFRDIIANFEADGWRLDASAITIDRGDGEVFEDPGDLSDEPAPLLFSTRALGDEGTVAFRFVDDAHALDPSFSGQQLEIRVFLAAEVATSGTALDDPSVLSDLKTFQQAAPTPPRPRSSAYRRCCSPC